MTTIDPAWLQTVTGGANASKALETQITNLKSTLEDAVRAQKESSSTSMEKLLPIMMIAKMRR
jgi:hypothetical protein